VCTPAVSGPVGSAPVVVCGIGTALAQLVGYPQGFFGALAGKISAAGFGLAPGPNILPQIKIDPKGPPTRDGKASGAPRGCQSVFRSGRTSVGGHGAGGRNPPSADLPVSGATGF
jgi:hypothetical protein